MNIFLLMGFTLFFTGCEVINGFTPEEGEWTVHRYETMSNTCGFEDEQAEQDIGSNDKDTFTISSTEDGGYHIDLDEDMILYCQLDNQELTCEPFEFTEDDVEMAMTITQIMTHSGTFSSETELNGSVKVDMDCAGDGCSMLEMFGITVPCTAEMTMLASK